MKPLYQYTPGPATLGIGVGNLGLAQPQTLPLLNYTGGGRPVRRDLAPLATTPQVFAPQTVTPVSLRGNGVYLSGQVVLQALTDFKANGGKTQ